MAGHIHAIILLTCPLLLAVCLTQFKRRKPTAIQALWPAFVAVLLMFIASVRVLWDEGQAALQWVIPGACMYFALAYINGRMLRRCLALVMVICLFGLTYQYQDLVGSRAWTGNPSGRRIEIFGRATARRLIAELREDTNYADANFGAGWLRDLPIWPRLVVINNENLIRGFDFDAPTRRIGIPQWHTWFTRLYVEGKTPVDYWYAGGPLETADIEIRERMRTATTQPVETNRD